MSLHGWESSPIKTHRGENLLFYYACVVIREELYLVECFPKMHKHSFGVKPSLWLVCVALWPHSCAASPLLSPTSPSTLASRTSPLPHPLSRSWPRLQLVHPPSAWPWRARLPLERVRGTPWLRPLWVETRPSLAWLCPCAGCWNAAAPPPLCSPACRRNATRLPGQAAASSPLARISPVRFHPDGLPSECASVCACMIHCCARSTQIFELSQSSNTIMWKYHGTNISN